jgi:S-adenosylmethionine synthetase
MSKTAFKSLFQQARSDELSDAAKAQGTVTTGVGVGVSTTDANGTTIGVGAAQFQTTPNNILTVEYVFNGQRFKKQAAEGTQLILP